MPRARRVSQLGLHAVSILVATAVLSCHIASSTLSTPAVAWRATSDQTSWSDILCCCGRSVVALQVRTSLRS